MYLDKRLLIICGLTWIILELIFKSQFFNNFLTAGLVLLTLGISIETKKKS